MEYPKISIVTPSFNSSLTIKECIESVANQNYPNLEHWFIDGNSNDDTLNIIETYAKKHPHIKYISEKDKGIYDAMNKGIDRATGEWIYFLGTDDVLCEGVLREIFEGGKYKDVDFLYGDVKIKNSHDIYDGFFSTLKISEKNICHQAIFYKKVLFNVIGKFDLKYKILADYAFNIKIFGNSKSSILYIKQNIAVYNWGGQSSEKLDIPFFRDYKKLVKFNLKIDKSNREIFENIGRMGLIRLQEKRILKGIYYIAFAFAYRPFYYFKNSLYWLKIYLFTRVNLRNHVQK